MKHAKRTTSAVVVILLVVLALALAASTVVAQPGAEAPATAETTETTALAVQSSAAGAATTNSATTALWTSPLLAAGSSSVMFAEGFEGTLSSWQASGSPTWGITSYRASAGQSSAYCAQSSIPAPGPYANDMGAWLKAGPFDLSKVTAASLSYKFYLKSEEDVDSVVNLFSLNGTNWSGWATSGSVSGWTARTRNLTAIPTIGNLCGKSQVWIAFRFESNDWLTDEGAYIDEIKLTDETPPAVTTIAPTSGSAGSTVTLSGAGLAGATAVKFNGVAAQFNAVSATQINATVPAGATSGPITVISPYGTGGSAASFTVTVSPRITKFTPAAGPVGTSVTVQGTDLAGATQVTFNGVSAAYSGNSSAQITAVVPVGASSGAIVVTTPAGTATSASAFAVTVKPQLARLSPASAKHGATITLTGKDFGAKRGTGYIKFGATKCTKFVSWSGKRIKCKVPAKAKFGRIKVSVVTTGGTSAAKTFTVKR